MAQYYDLVLGLIPLALAGVTGALVLAGLEPTAAVLAASVVAAALTGHAMFVRAPTDTASPTGEFPGNAD